MRIVKPRAIQKGDVIGIAAPASPPISEEKLEKGIRYLETLGYRVALGKHIYRKQGYLAGSDLQRASDLNDFFADANVKAIFTVRGGYGSHRLLPLLDYNLIRRHPKILVGYSDITALQIALFTQTGLITFSGPMVAVEMAKGLTGATEELFWQSLTCTNQVTAFHHHRDERPSKRKKGTSSGRVVGGNLSLVAALVGTPYFPRTRNLVWLLEEVGELPYRIDRMFQQMILSNVIQRSRGVLLGHFLDCEPEKGKPSLSLRQVFEEVFQEYGNPVVSGVRFGHIKNSLTIPLGVRVEIDGSKGTTHFLEAGVS